MAYDATISRLPVRAIFDLKGARADLADWCGAALPPFPPRPNSGTEAAGRRLVHVGPDHWLLFAEEAEEEALVGALRPEHAPPGISVVLISDTLAGFAVTGPEAGEVMAVATPLDLYPRVFAPDGESWTEAFGARALIRRVAGGYEIAVDRSYADWFEEMLDRVRG